MSTIKILDSARPQPLSPLFTRLPTELRLMIYTFVFMGCQVSIKRDFPIDCLWTRIGPDEFPETHVSHYKHLGGGFGLLRTCRMAYIEAFDTYWSESVLRMSCVRTFETCCADLPAAIKRNVRHIRWVKTPAFGPMQAVVEDPYRIPALLAEFPKLISCAFYNVEARPETGPFTTEEWLYRVPDANIRAQGYEGVGPFEMRSGESPAAYIERTIGGRLSDKVTILSRDLGGRPRDCPRDYRSRMRFFNWATGMVHQTTSDLKPSDLIGHEDAYQQALRARPGDEWSRSYYVFD